MSENLPFSWTGVPAMLKFWLLAEAFNVLMAPDSITSPLSACLAGSKSTDRVSVLTSALAVPVTVTEEVPAVMVAVSGFWVRVQVVPWAWKEPVALPVAV
ncbi:MAG: hypothetical protein ACKOS8_02860, partial [Gemmataceae bacterium]